SLKSGASKTGSSRYAADGTLFPCPPQSDREQISDALYFACRNRHADVVRFLLGKNPDLSFLAFMGGTCLHWAYFGGSSTVVEMLVKQGANPEVRDTVLGCLPRSFGICAASNWGLAFLVKARLAEDPSLVNIMDGTTSPLHEAARNNRTEVVRLLLDNGANP